MTRRSQRAERDLARARRVDAVAISMSDQAGRLRVEAAELSAAAASLKAAAGTGPKA